MDFYSKRFSKNVWITHHARHSMKKRGVDDELLQLVIENGDIRRKDDAHMWVYLSMPERDDNLVCAAMVEAVALVVKTVMINWTLEDEK